MLKAQRMSSQPLIIILIYFCFVLCTMVLYHFDCQ